MSDTQVVEPEQAETEETPKPTKKAAEPHACYCQTYEVYDPKDAESVFATGCEQNTKATFAQGHDARLVSFLVDGHFDGYKIRQIHGDQPVEHDTPADAVNHVSVPLAEKANKATLNRKAKIDGAAERAANRDKLRLERQAKKEADKKAKQAEKEAAKADGPKATGAEVVAGSQTGDLPELPEGHARIKVGKFEYTAAIDDEGNATYVDGAGDEQVVNRDGYRLLSV